MQVYQRGMQIMQGRLHTQAAAVPPWQQQQQQQQVPEPGGQLGEWQQALQQGQRAAADDFPELDAALLFDLEDGPPQQPRRQAALHPLHQAHAPAAAQAGLAPCQPVQPRVDEFGVSVAPSLSGGGAFPVPQASSPGMLDGTQQAPHILLRADDAESDHLSPLHQHQAEQPPPLHGAGAHALSGGLLGMQPGWPGPGAPRMGGPVASRPLAAQQVYGFDGGGAAPGQGVR